MNTDEYLVLKDYRGTLQGIPEFKCGATRLPFWGGGVPELAQSGVRGNAIQFFFLIRISVELLVGKRNIGGTVSTVNAI